MLTHYIGNITYVEPGQIIVVVGKTTDAATRLDTVFNRILVLYLLTNFHCFIDLNNRLDLNFRTGKNSNDDIALNLSVDFRENVIYRNSCINSEWGPKECKENLYEREDGLINPIESGENH